MTDIFKVKIGLSPKPMNGIFENLAKNRTPCEEIQNSGLWIQTTNYDTETQKNMAQNLFPNECKAII